MLFADSQFQRKVLVVFGRRYDANSYGYQVYARSPDVKLAANEYLWRKVKHRKGN